jgi:hypothetical protein
VLAVPATTAIAVATVGRQSARHGPAGSVDN